MPTARGVRNSKVSPTIGDEIGSTTCASIPVPLTDLPNVPQHFRTPDGIDNGSDGTNDMATKKVSGQVLGYRRISAEGQRHDRQLDGVDVDRMFEDTISGSKRARPGLDAMLGHIRAGDTVVAHSIDRVARSVVDLHEIVGAITASGATVRFVTEGLVFDGATENPTADLLLNLLGSVAQFERQLIRSRTAEGRKVAKGKGVRFGRPPALSAKARAEVVAERRGEKSISALALDHDVSRRTIHRVLDEAGMRASDAA